MQILASVSEACKNFAVVYLVDISEVPDFNTMYELYDPCTTMFFFRNKVTPTPPQHHLGSTITPRLRLPGAPPPMYGWDQVLSILHPLWNVSGTHLPCHLLSFVQGPGSCKIANLCTL